MKRGAEGIVCTVPFSFAQKQEYQLWPNLYLPPTI